QATTRVADESTYRAVDPATVTIAPDGSLLVLGALDYGSYLPFAEPGAPPALALVEFVNAPPDGPDAAPSAGRLRGAEPSANIPADAIFQMLTPDGSSTGAAPVGPSGAGNSFTLPTPFTPGATLLPIPIQSQTAAVARLSGGGGGVVNP